MYAIFRYPLPKKTTENKSPRLSSFFKIFLTLVVLVSFFLLAHTSVYATTYYVANAGNDSCDGTSQTIGSSGTCAWKTIAKVNASSFSAGDFISFNKGDTWREQLNIPSSGSSGNPITFNSYGSGNKPKIYGSTVPSSWTSESYAPTYTISKVQGPPTIGSGTTSATSTFSSTPVQNNLLIASLGCGSSTAGISSAGISGFSLASSGVMGTSNGFISIWYKVAGAGESTGVTATITGGVTCNLVIEEWTNLTASSPLDQTSFTNDTGGTVTSRSSGTTPTTTVASELVVAGVMTGNTTTGKSWNNSFTSEYSNDSFSIVTSSKIVSSTGAYESTLSWTTARRAGGTIATFKGLSGATTQLYYTSQSVDPGYIWFIDTGGTVHYGNKVVSKDLLLNDYDWWFDSVNSRLYINSATDPLTRYNSVEVTDTSRVRGIFWTGSGESYITIDGFEVAFVGGAGIVTRGDYWTIINNNVHHLGDQTPTGHSYGIELQTTNYTRVANNNVHDTLRSCVYLVTSYTPFINTNNTIESNTLYDCAEAIFLANTENTHGTNVFNSSIIRYNNMYHSSSFSLGTGSGYGIRLVGYSGFPVDSYQIYYNTISVKKKAISLDNYVTNTNIYNNSILANGSGAGSGMGIYISGTGNSGITIKNNLVADAGLYGLDVVDMTAVSSLDNNVWYAPTGTGYANIDGVNYTSSGFAAYKSATGWDTNGYWQNPLIVSASNFYLQLGSPARDSGTNISLTTDYAGTSVPQGSSPDIGAYEFIPLTVTINQASGQSDPTSSSTVDFTVVFNESVSDFATGDVTLSGTAGATTAVVTGSGTTYNVAVTGMTGAGTVIASISANKATGATLGVNEASTSSDNSVTYTVSTPAATSTPSSSTTSSSSSILTPICSDQAPGVKAPWLYGAIAQDSGSVLLYFTEADNPVNKYVLEYGTKSGDYLYGVQDMGINTRGQMTYLVKLLSPNTTYYFKVRGGNGCATGSWSNEISVKTREFVSFNQLNFPTSELIPQSPPEKPQQASCQRYTVHAGDSLWSIAQDFLNDGDKFKEIIEQNIELYPTLTSSNNVDPGWELKINCTVRDNQPTKEDAAVEKPVSGDYIVKVKVLDVEKKPIKGAKVTIHSKVQEAITNIDGIAQFTNVEQGDHKVLIEYKNFEGEQSLNLTGDVKEFALNVTIEQKPFSISPLAGGIIGTMGVVIVGLVIFIKRRKIV